MDISPRQFKVVKRAGNRHWTLYQEISRSMNIPRGQMFKMMKLKGIENCDELFRYTLKQDFPNKTALFLSLLAKIPSKRFTKVKKPKQLILFRKSPPHKIKN